MFVLSATISLATASPFEGKLDFGLLRRMTMPSMPGMPAPTYTSASGDYIARTESHCDGFTYIDTFQECDLAAQDLGLPDQEATVLNTVGGMQATGLQQGCILFMHSHLFFNHDGLDAGEPNPLSALTICKVGAAATTVPPTTTDQPASSDSDETTEQPLHCRSWCPGSTKPWDRKCTWQSCGGCSECSAAGDATTTTTAPVVTDCKNWCANSPTPWADKCAWPSGNCAACTECVATPSTTTPAPQCLGWCANHGASWDTKCGWANAKCSACTECAGL